MTGHKTQPNAEKSSTETRRDGAAPAAATPIVARDGIVLGSIALASTAATVLAHHNVGLSLAESAPVGLATCLALTAVHVMVRRAITGQGRKAKPARSRPAAPVNAADGTRRGPQLPPVLTPTLDTSYKPSSAPADPAGRPIATIPPAPMRPANDKQDSVTTLPDTATLQKLIAELARTVPGPKAATPDPDLEQRPPVAPHSEPPASPTANLDATMTAEANALRAAAEAMASAAPVTSSVIDIIDAALRDERITTYLEPIQALDARRARHFEVSIRLRAPDGSELAHDEVETAAQRAGLTPRLDAAKLPRAARIATHLAERGRGYDILSTIAALSITDPAFQDVLAEVFYDHDTPHVVLSFTQEDVRDFAPVHWQALHAISTYGVRFAIESLTDLDLDFEALKACGFDYVKLDADVLLAGLPAPSGLIPTDHICRYLSTLGFSIVVTKLEDEETLARVMGFGVLMGQGSLFGGRRPVKAEVLTAREAA